MSDTLRVKPDPTDPRLTRRVTGIDHTGAPVETSVTVERPMTLFLNGQEIVTMMTIGDRPEDLALGYLLNQGMLKPDAEVTGVDYDDDLGVVIVRTPERTDFEEKLRKKTLTSGCAQGTAFGDLMEGFAQVRLAKSELRTSWLYRLLHRINTLPTLYLEAGAIHGCALCLRDEPVVYMEDVGRHNAVDKIAGWMFRERESAGRQDLLHHRPADLGNGDQDGADGYPDPGLPLRLHRLGRGTREGGRPDADRPLQGPALRRAGRAGAHRLRRRPELRRGGNRRSTGARTAPRRWRRATMRADTLGCVLAGGLARRMGGGDKPLRLLGGRPMLDHALGRLMPQVAAVILNANGDPARFASYRPAGCPRRAAGPSRSARGHPRRAGLGGGAPAGSRAGWSRCPAILRSFRMTSWRACMRRGRAPACRWPAHDRTARRHPPIGLWPVSLRDDLRAALLAGERKIDRWTARHGCAPADWPSLPVDPFFNANAPEDLTEAERLLTLLHSTGRVAIDT